MPKSATEQIKEAASQPTMDEYMRRDPAKLGKGDLPHMVDLLRGDRAAFLERESKKAAKKEGLDE